jgi:hypothetical protein
MYMETNLQTSKLGSFPGAALTIAETVIDRARVPERKVPLPGRPTDSTEQLKVVQGLLKTLLTFMSEMMKMFEKMRSGGEKSPTPANPPPVNSTPVSQTPVNPTPVSQTPANQTPVNSAPPITPQPTLPTPSETDTSGKKFEDTFLETFANQLKGIFDQMTSMQKRVDRLSRKISGLGRKLLKGIK